MKKVKIKNRLVNGYVQTNNAFKLREHQNMGKGWLDFIPAGSIVSNVKDLNIWDTKLHKGKNPKTRNLQTYDKL